VNERGRIGVIREKNKYNKERVSDKGTKVLNNESCGNKDVWIVRQQYGRRNNRNLAEAISTKKTIRRPSDTP
jgi:Lhr-like helicase